MADIVSEKSHKKRLHFLSKNMPKLPKGSYKKDLKEFLILIKEYPIEFRKRLLKKYKVLNKAFTQQSREQREIDGRYHTKLSDLQKMEIIELSGRYFSAPQIMDIIRNEWGIKYSNASLNTLLRNNKELIFDKRKKYGSSIDGLRLVHERPRLEEYTNIYEEAREVGNNKLALDVLKEIRQEVKGDRLIVDGNINLNANINVKEHILKNTNIENFAKLAMMNLFDKHGIDFLKIAHRFKTEKITRDPVTGDEIEPRLLPVKVSDVGVLSDNKVKKSLAVEEAKFTEEVRDNLKDNLLSKLNERKKEIKDLENKIDFREEIDKPEDLENIKRRDEKKREKIKKKVSKVDPKIVSKILAKRKLEADKKNDKRRKNNKL